MIHFTGEKEPHLSVGYISPVSVMWNVVEISCPVSPDSVPDTVWSSSSPHKQRETPLARSPLIVWCLVTILSRGITMKESGTAATATIKLRVKCYVEEPISQISNYTKVKLPWKLTRKSQGIENKWFKTLKNIYCWTGGKYEGTVMQVGLHCSVQTCHLVQYSTVNCIALWGADVPLIARSSHRVKYVISRHYITLQLARDYNPRGWLISLISTE